MKLGEKQRLSIVKREPFGVYLAEHMPARGERVSELEKVLLPIKQLPDGLDIGDSLEVFLYKDSKDRPIATVHEPAMTLGRIAKVRVAEVTRIGAFLSWGLEKDLFLPYKEQTKKVEAKDEILAALYIDKSNRLAATMKLYPYLMTAECYQKDDIVTGTVYEIAPGFGAYVAVDDQYHALIPQKELTGTPLFVGDIAEARVTGVKEDGKLDLSLRRKAYMQLDPDGEKIMNILLKNGGKMPIGDKTSPEKIRDVFQMSKNEFKRAAGHLYKEHKIAISDAWIELLQDKEP